MSANAQRFESLKAWRFSSAPQLKTTAICLRHHDDQADRAGWRGAALPVRPRVAPTSGNAIRPETVQGEGTVGIEK